MNTTVDTQTAIDSSVIISTLRHQIAFHRRWKAIMMWVYSISSLGIIVCSTAAMLFAALNHGTTAALFAAGSTVLASAEKSLLLREKWKLHLSSQIALQNVEIDLEAGVVDIKAGLHEMKRIGQSYGKDLPVESRIG